MKDILINEDGSLKITDGDLTIGESTIQHQSLIIKASKGGVKHYPALGVNVSEVLLDESPDGFILSIRKEFKRDGMLVKSLNLEKSKIKIEAHYENI